MSIGRWVAVCAAVAVGAILWIGRRSNPPSLDLGIWYWHTPFQISDHERALMKSAGIGSVYVRFGTFTTDGAHALLELPQTWKSQPGSLAIEAVFNFDPGLVRHIDELPVDTMASDVSDRIKNSLAEAASHGVHASGVQLDVDCPTRLLSKYADLLRRVRARIGPVGSFSITALPTWIQSPEFVKLSRSVDYVVPQFYEGRVARTLKNIQPVSDPAALERGIRKLDSLGVPYRIGLPAYGHALLYDDKGRLLSMYRGLSSEDALRLPALRYVSTSPLDRNGGPTNAANYIGEDLMTLEAVRPDRNGHGLGDRIAYLLPAMDMVAKGLNFVRANAGPRCKGAILYRFPESGETTALPLESIDAAVRNRPGVLGFRVDASSKSIPFSLIGEHSAHSVPHELTVRLTSDGNAGTKTAPDALEALVLLDRPGIGDIAPGDFDSAQAGKLDHGRFVACGRARANSILFRRGNALPGQVLRTGAIELTEDGASSVQILWTAQGMGGFKTFHGASPKWKLADLKE